tara:strand:- start:67 stop:288 length:222 start_codon:yes stop_codon:yes gene_type:complete
MCKKMANLIQELVPLSPEEQEDALSNLSKKLHPIQIDDKVYMIPEEVNELIENLSEQISNFKKDIPEFGREKN